MPTFYRLLSLLFYLSLASEVLATQFIPISVEEMTRRSELILAGKVLSKTCLSGERGMIYTRVELQVDDVWKGTLATNRYTVVQAGGVLGERKTVVNGQAQFVIGEEVVVFLVLNPAGEGITLGLAQGKFKVWTDAGSGVKLTRNLFHGGPDPAAFGGSKQLQRVPSNWRLKLTDLRQQVQSVK
jgi:hypothetical protein